MIPEIDPGPGGHFPQKCTTNENVSTYYAKLTHDNFSDEEGAEWAEPHPGDLTPKSTEFAEQLRNSHCRPTR